MQKACDVIRDYDKADPFFMYVGVTGPHDPYCPPKEYIQLYEGVDMKLPESFDDPMEDKPALYRRTRRRFDLTLEEEKESMRRYLAFVSFEDAMFGRLLDVYKRQAISMLIEKSKGQKVEDYQIVPKLIIRESSSRNDL